MKSPAVILLVFMLLTLPSLADQPQPAQPLVPPTVTLIPELRLVSGRILHDAKIKSERPTTLMVWCKEGLVSVAKSDLPKDLAAIYKLDPQAAAEENERAQAAAKILEAAAEKAKQLTAEKRAAKLRDGLEIISWEAHVGAVNVTLINQTNMPQTGLVDALVLKKDGATYAGDFRVEQGERAGGLLEVPGRAQRKFLIIFNGIADMSGANDVIWKQ